MKTANKILLICAGAVMAVPAASQTISDALRYSQYNYGFSTPRSAAMGGAFSSLGADQSSLIMNPAGLGMYRSSEIMFAPMVTINKMDSHYAGLDRNASKSTLGVGNMGMVLNLRNNSSSGVSITVGFGYNKLVDFNTSSFVQGYDRASMLNYFADQAEGISSDLLSHEYDPFYEFRNDKAKWGSALAYQTYLIDETSPGSTMYRPSWGRDMPVDMILRNRTEGSVGEYSFGAGFNVNNVFYFGASVGMQDIYYRNENSYFEYASAEQPEGVLDSYLYTRYHTQTGTGINLKFGVVVRPVTNLRIGAAFHTPTYSNIEYRYIENMASFFNRPSELDRNYDSPAMVNDYNMNTAPRLMTGISYTLPGTGLISADYERVWYNGQRIRNSGDHSYDDILKNDMKAYYRPANNFRVGLELTPTRNLFIRGGYAYYDNSLRTEQILTNILEINNYQNYSGGIGYRFSNNLSLDISYVYTDYEYADSELFPNAADDPAYGLIKTSHNRHTISLGFGLRF